MKRLQIRLTGGDKYGHWWFEIGDPSDPDSESYGWWPERPVSLGETLGGIQGVLNASYAGGTLTRDRHHGEESGEKFGLIEVFHPLVAASDTRTDDEIAACLRHFAQTYAGEWRWTFGYGTNCHTFQEEAMLKCELRKSAPKSLL